MASDPRPTALLLLGASGLLFGALGFQYLGGLAPCEMCLWQRYALLVVIGLGLLAWAARNARAVQLLAALAMAADAALGLFHVGVEQHWWQGITTCAAAPVTGSTSAIMAQVLAQPLVRCDAIPWSLFGISMAGWNAIVAALLTGAALWLILTPRRH
jgi:disulfide bond formation protein DsbB